MVSVFITLSDEDLSLARNRAAQEGFVGIEDYLLDAVAQRLHGPADDDDLGAPDHLCMKSVDQLKEAIRVGINNPGRKFSEADFAQMGRELKEKGRISKG